MTSDLKSYGLKITTPYDSKNITKKTIPNAYGDIVLAESGVYEIYCTGDTHIWHNITGNLMHVTAISGADNIKININATGRLVDKEISDIYHSIVVDHKNVFSNINSRGVASEQSKLIYRSSLGAKINASGTGRQSAKFILLSDYSEIDAEPSLDICSDTYHTSHAIGVSGVSPENMWYLAMRGYDTLRSQDELVDGFLNLKNN